MIRSTTLAAIAAITVLSACNKSEGTAKASLPPIPVRPAAAQGSLVLVGTLQALPGALPANDLYKYAYVMKYTVDTVVEGVFEGKEILVGQYDPRTPRAAIADDQKGLVGGNVAGFQEGDRHYLVLRPLDSAWTGAIEDGYIRETTPRWWASWTDRI
jgi:hypothetical protein